MLSCRTAHRPVPHLLFSSSCFEPYVHAHQSIFFLLLLFYILPFCTENVYIYIQAMFRCAFLLFRFELTIPLTCLGLGTLIFSSGFLLFPPQVTPPPSQLSPLFPPPLFCLPLSQVLPVARDWSPSSVSCNYIPRVSFFSPTNHTCVLISAPSEWL